MGILCSLAKKSLKALHGNAFSDFYQPKCPFNSNVAKGRLNDIFQTAFYRFYTGQRLFIVFRMVVDAYRRVDGAGERCGQGFVGGEFLQVGFVDIAGGIAAAEA